MELSLRRALPASTRKTGPLPFTMRAGKIPVPCANLALLMLGPGVSITHAAISVLADHGCLVAWCGEEGVRFYALGMGETRSAANFLHQARVWAHDGLPHGGGAPHVPVALFRKIRCRP